MRIICVDAEKPILELTVSMCRELPQKPEVIGFVKAKDTLEWMHNNRADIALLDINLSDMNGLKLAAMISKISPNTAICQQRIRYASNAICIASMTATQRLSTLSEAST